LETNQEEDMTTIKVIELIGTSKQSWEDAASNAIKEAHETVSGITGLEVVGQTARVENGLIAEYRANLKVAFLVKEDR
jgi:flavin-binding protein dodecin